MVDLVHLATYVPPRVLRAMLAAGASGLHPRVDRFYGALLFVDISGFTDLSDSLARKGPEGTEELSSLVNSYFRAILGHVARSGGDILTMAGDALVVAWEGRDAKSLREPVWRAVHCGLTIQSAQAQGGGVTVRIGIGAGVAEIHYVGGIDDRWEAVPMVFCSGPGATTCNADCPDQRDAGQSAHSAN